MQRRTAAVLRPMAEQGHLVLHDVTLPGWLDSLDHLVLGPTGVWVAALGQLPGIVRSGPATPPGELEQATGRLLEVLRPAA